MAEAVGKRVKLTLTWRQRRGFVLAVIAFQAMVWTDALLNRGRLGGGWQTAMVGILLVGMAAATWWIGTSVSRRGLVVHSVPVLTIPWDDVHQIEVQSSLGISTVIVHHGASRHTRLAAPTTGLMGRDDAFQDKVRVLREFWADHLASGTAA